MTTDVITFLFTGSAGGNTVGTARCANIYGLKSLDNSGSGYLSGILAAMDVVKQRHVSNPNAKSVVSMSLGGSCGTSCSGNPLFDAISTMHDLGILFAVAAGNDYNGNACLTFPAGAPKAVTVAASDEFDNFASYSNTGPCVDIIAPGSLINSAQAGTSSYTKFSGTSMATPHVAGTLALLLQKRMVSFTTAPDIVTKALLCDAVKDKIKNIIRKSFGTSVNLLLQVPKNDNRFGECLTPTARPSFRPTTKPSTATSIASPTTMPSVKPTAITVRVPTTIPSLRPSKAPSSIIPSAQPVAAASSRAPSLVPTAKSSTAVPTRKPTQSPSAKSTTVPPSVAPGAIGDGCFSAGVQYYTEPGYYCVGLRAYSCPAGFFCPGGEGGYGYSCPLQSTSSTGMSVCVPLTSTYGGDCTGCNAGDYCAVVGQRRRAQCYNCPAGSYCPGNNRGYLCPAGTSNNNVRQVACVPNTPPVYGDSCGNGRYRCSIAGTYCVLSQGECMYCPAGTYCPNAFGSYAYECPAGKTSNVGAAICR